MTTPTLRAGQTGSGTALVAGAIVVTATVALVGILGAGYTTAAHRARAVADLAALSAASAQRDGADGCAIARRIARLQSASLVSCRIVGDALDYVVTVTAAVPVPARFPGLPAAASATAHAGLLTDSGTPR